MKLLLWLKLLVLLAVLKNTQSMPVSDLSNEDWNTLLKVIGKSNEISSNNDNEYYEPFTLKPIIFKLEFNDKFNRNIKTVAKEPEETNIWINVKTFFTNDLNSLVKDVVNKCNPIPPIVSVIDDVKRSDTWNDVNSFFTKAYNGIMKFSEGVLNNIKTTF